MASRKAHRKHKTHRRRSRRHSRRHSRKQGGAILTGAPLSESLAGSWSSKMAMGQGGDYLEYHKGQHGGAHLAGVPLSAIGGEILPTALRGPAHVGGLDRAFADIGGMRDQAGGRRRRKRTKSKGKKRASRRSRRKQGGAVLGYSPYPSGGMLLSGRAVAQSGISPAWNGGVEFDAAKMRQGV